MRRKTKRLLSMLLCAVLVLTLLPVTALAADPTAVTLSGIAKLGRTLTATVEPADANLSAYTWSRSSDGNTYDVITGAAGATYTIKAEDVGYRIKVTAINGPGTSSVDSEPTDVITAPVTFTADGIIYEVLTDNGDGTGMAEVYKNPSAAGTISIPPSVTNDEVTYTVTSIGYQAFYGSFSLSGVTIPDSVTAIEEMAFVATNLSSITIPSSVTSVGDLAFVNNSNLAAIYFEGNAPTLGGDVFRGDSASLKLYYHQGATGFDAIYASYSSVLSLAVQYAVTVDSGISGGSITCSPAYAAAGQTVTLTVTPDVGKELESLSYNDGTSNHDITGESFTMPGGPVTVTAEFIVEVPRTPVSINENPQHVTFNYYEQSFAISGTPSTGFNVTYNQGNGNVTPFYPGTYNIVITRPKDDTYAAYSKTITGGLVIDSATINAAAIGPTAPSTGATPVSEIETAQYTGTVTWAPNDSPFAASTAYTATITLTAETGYTLTGVVENFFTIVGATSVTNEADSEFITAVFPATRPASTGGGGGGSPTKEGLIPVEDLANSGDKQSIIIENDIAKVTVPSNMLAGVSGIDGKQAEIVIKSGDKNTLPEDVKAAIGNRPLISLSLEIDGKQTDWNNPSAPVTVSIPYTPTAAELANPERIVIWYIDGSGNTVAIPNGHYDAATGTVAFSTTHFSYYAVAYNKVSFNDVAADAWYYNAVSFVAARSITSGTGTGDYSPDALLTRGEFLVLIMRAYDIAPDENPTDNFSDAGDTYYTGYLAAAKRLGISAGLGNNMYAPDKEIARQEMFTLLYNALKVMGQLPEGDSSKTLSDFTDAGQIDTWAKEAMALLVKTGTVGGSNGKLTPQGTTTRAEMAQVLYNLLGK